jgi:hypothetical protein
MNHLASRSDADEQARRVRVWFGRHVIATYVADPGEAERYARAMARRFAGLRVTIDDETSRFEPLLPDRVWWDRPPLRQR